MTYGIIIVNWNAGELLKKCIDSINNSDFDKSELKVIIVDNASIDHSLNGINYSFVRIIRNEENKGFAAACNQGIRLIDAKYILLLNPDTVLMKDTLAKSAYFMETNSEISVLGCKHVDENNYIKRSCAKFPGIHNFIYDSIGLSKIYPRLFHSATIMDYWDHKNSMFVDQVMGAFMLVRKSVLDKVGYLDEIFFIYFEEMDLSLRIIQQGGKVYYNSDIQIFHEGEGTSKQVKAKRLFYSLTSRLKFVKKHFSKLNYGIVITFTLFVEPFTRSIYLLINKDTKGIKEVTAAYKLLYAGFFSKRKQR